MFNPQPKPEKKEKKSFGFEYWNKLNAESHKKRISKKAKKKDELDDWYRFIYDLHGGLCAESGRKLDFNKCYCAHLLPKKDSGVINNYSYFATDHRNGILLDLPYHDILDKGSAKQRKELKVWDAICFRRRRLLEECGKDYDEDYWLNMKV